MATTLLLCELGLRAVLGNMAIAALYDPAPPDGRCIALRPGAAVRFNGMVLRIPAVEHEVNRQGHRGPERPMTREADVLRVATVGDSFTYGMGVSVDQTFAASLERALRHAGHRDAEVMNFGIPGADLPDIPDLIGFAGRWHPDVVLHFTEGGDLFMRPEGPRSVCGLRRFPGLHRALLRYCYLCRIPLLLYIRAANTRDPGGANDGDAETFRSLLGRSANAAKRVGARYMVVSVAGLPPLRDGDAAALVTELGVPFMELSEALRRHRFPNDGHCTPEGTELVGRRVGRWLNDLGLVGAAR